MMIMALAYVCMVAAFPLYGRGTPEDAWEAVSGDEIWRHEFDLSELSPGTHNVVVRARDFAGNESIGGPFNIRIDPAATLPSLRIVYPDEGTVLRESFSVMGVADSFFSVDRVEIAINDGPFSAAEGTDYWGRVVDINEIPDGPITVRARALDSRGQVGETFSLSVILDRAAPVIAIDSHDPGAIVNGRIRVEGRADDANGIDSVELSVDGGRSYEELRARRSRGATEVSFSFPVQTGNLPDGPLAYSIRAKDSTGAVAEFPVFFYVDNQAPELEILSPEQDEPLSGRVQFSGRVRDTVGIERLFYERNREEHEIPLRPGDPYWSTIIDLGGESGRSSSVRFTTVDRSGNSTSVTRRIALDAGNMLPQVLLVHPDEEMYRSLTVDSAFYGELAGAGVAQTVIVEGALEREYPAQPGFRIPAADIPLGRGDLRIRGRFADGTEGPPIRIRVEHISELEELRIPEQSRIQLNSVAAYDYLSAGSVALVGEVLSFVPNQRLQYRLQPDEPWSAVPITQGEFSADVGLSGRQPGTIHLELRTLIGQEADLPLYVPINYVPDSPEIRVITPQAGDSVNGITTVAGTVLAGAPIQEFFYRIDEETMIPVPVDRGPGGGSFVFPLDFTQLEQDHGQFTIHVTDQAGNASTVTPRYQVDVERDYPTVQVFEPEDGAIVKDDIILSGMAFDDDAVAAVHWRIGDAEFTRVVTDQSYRIDLRLDEFDPGEQRIEIFAEDIYGLRGDPVSVSIQVSQDRPVIEVLEPSSEAPVRGAIVVRGTASDMNGIDSVQLSMDNGNTFQSAMGTEEWSLNLNTTAYQDGTYSLLIIATDTLGVESRATSLINIDNTAPGLKLVYPYDGQLVDGSLNLAGGVEDNIGTDRLTLQLASVLDEDNEIFETEIESSVVLQEEIDISWFAPGTYSLRLSAVDLAGNRSVVTRDIEVAQGTRGYSVELITPLPGATRVPPILVAGQVHGPVLPTAVQLYDGEQVIQTVEVTRNGFFELELPERLSRQESVGLTAQYTTKQGEVVHSALHEITVMGEGPRVAIESHSNGEMITGRPWLRGSAVIELTEEEQAVTGRRDRQQFNVSEVLVSIDNGRSFVKARGGEEWRFRLETAEMEQGAVPLLVKAVFGDGRTATDRLVLIVDTTPPTILVDSPIENSRHAESLLVHGSAQDEFGIEQLQVSLRQGDKSGYEVPQFIQGLYLDTQVGGATYGSAGVGLSFFDDNVRLQVHAGVAPPGRFTGNVLGGKLLANVVALPFNYFFGPDWSFFSMALALGANFSYFTMDEDDGLVLSAILAQWEFARFQVETWSFMNQFSLYAEPSLWFISSDVEAGTVFKLSLGLRVNIL